MDQLAYQKVLIREELLEIKNIDKNIIPRSKRMSRLLVNMESRR